MDLKGKRVLVFGSGKSGIGAAELLGQVGACPVLYDGNPDLDKEAVLHKTASIKETDIYAGGLPEERLNLLSVQGKGEFLQLPEQTEKQQQQPFLERSWRMPRILYL